MKPEYVFLFIASIFGLASVFLVPILMVPDEFFHLTKAFTTFTPSPDGSLPQDLQPGDFFTTVRTALESGTYAEFFTKRIDISATLVLDGKDVNYYLNTGFLDVSHLPQAVGVLIAQAVYPSLGVMVLCGRLTNLAFTIVAVFFTIKWLRFGKWPLVFIATTPMMIQQMGSLSYDAINMVAIFAFVGLMMNLFIQESPLSVRQFLGLLALSVLLLLTKQNNVFLLLLIPLLPVELYKGLPPVKHLFNALSKRQLVIGISLVVCVVCVLTVVLLLGKLEGIDLHIPHTLKVLFSTLMSTDMPGWPPFNREVAQIDPITVTGIFGTFGWVEYRLPEWAVCFGFSVLLVLFLNDGEFVKIPKRFAIASLVVFILCVGSIFLAAYYFWTAEGSWIIDGVHGRYITPFLFLLTPPFVYLQNHISLTFKKNPHHIGVLTAGSSVFLLCLSVILTLSCYWFLELFVYIH